MSKRLFVAIDLPDSTRQLLTDLDPDMRGVRWMERDQMHLTLGFFGDASEDVELRLREKLSAIAGNALFPNLTGYAMKIVNRFLPRNSDESGVQSRSGSELPRLTPEWMTRTADRAARDNNEGASSSMNR